MEKYHDKLVRIRFFEGIDKNELDSLLSCLSAKVRRFEKGQVIFQAGEPVREIGIVISGSINVIREDFFGNRSINAEVGPGGLFAEAFSCMEVKELPVTVQSAAESEVLFFDYKRLVSMCPASCRFHNRMIQNLMGVMAEKNLILNEKIEIMSKRTTREKLLAYLLRQSQKSGKTTFEIPFNRQELADYLSVDRSAMSSELGKLRDEGIISFWRSTFKLEKEKTKK